MSLFVVATPIGNLMDITFRAVETLKSVDIIACEDTRVSAKLCEKYGISAKLVSYHKFSEAQKSSWIVEKIKEGKTVALISDAGTPLICDPGGELIENCLKNGIKPVPVGGISAISTFLSALPKKTADFYFVGFLPRKEGEIKALFQARCEENLVFFESANRLIKSLQFLAPQTLVAVGRELTKVYEEIIVDSAQNVIKHFENGVLKGEIVAMVFAQNEAEIDDAKVLQRAKKLAEQGFSSKDIAKILCTLDGVPKNKIKDLII